MKHPLFLRTALSVAVCFFVVSCANTGNSEFQCKGYEDGLPCRTASEVYRATDGSDWKQTAPQTGAQAAPATGVYQYGGPLMVPVEGGVPVMQQAVPLRVWIAPYEDAQEQLHWPGYVYTELRPRRWNFGEQAVRDSKVVSPLAIGTARRN